MQQNDKTSVLFVCLGNICRSPMAEAVFRHLVKQEGLEDRIIIDSAGTGDWHTGQPPHRGTRGILEQYGISYEGIRARQVKKQDFERFDIVVAMDGQNEADLQQIGRQLGAKVVKLLDLVPDAQLKDVPDPYYTGNFQEVYELIERGCTILLSQIREGGFRHVPKH